MQTSRPRKSQTRWDWNLNVVAIHSWWIKGCNGASKGISVYRFTSDQTEPMFSSAQ